MTSALRPAVLDGTDTGQLLLAEFQRAAMFVPAYQTLLAERGVRALDVGDVEAFTRLAPALSKTNTFDRFPLADLSVGGRLHDVAGVLTSSGHGGRFSFGVISRLEEASSAAFIDAALDGAFGVRSCRTLAINCLPMGVVVSSQCMTMATTSVREDMAVALVKTFGADYEQILLIGDPLFLKRLTDHAAEQGLDWRRHRVQVVIGEETFGEHFRTYLASCLGLRLDWPGSGQILSSFGVAELGLHLCFETPATAAVARAMSADPRLADAVLGPSRAGWQPMLFSFDPQRTFLEILEPDADGYGRLAISMLDPGRQVPLLRYQTGDVARLLERDEVTRVLLAHGERAGDLPAALVAIRGRVREALPNGSHVGTYKDSLYANPELARHVTGATRLVFADDGFTMHVQLVRGRRPHAAFEQALFDEIPERLRPSRVQLWRYEAFPFGMTLDYERKFQHYVADRA